jgi:hypothetical protein
MGGKTTILQFLRVRIEFEDNNNNNALTKVFPWGR